MRSSSGTIAMGSFQMIGLWAWATLLLMLIVTNIVNPGQISADISEPGWVLLLLSPTIAGSAWLGETRDRAAAALLLLLPLPWLFKPINAATNRHRTEYYDTYAVMASASFSVLQARVSRMSAQSNNRIDRSGLDDVLL